jgi:hypothetical protein
VKRRSFLKLAGGAGLVKVASAGGPENLWSAAQVNGPETAKAPTPAVVNAYRADEHRQRLENIATCERKIRKFLRKHLITNYLPGQCSYNLGEYPCHKVWNSEDWDEHELDKLKEQGISLVQVHEEWNDAERLFGADKLSPANPVGFQRFVEMVHKRGMKLIVYASSGFFERRDPDFRPEWARSPDLVELWYNYARCSPASPGWRAYLLSRLVKILEDYGVDGFYNDLGYLNLAARGVKPSADEIPATERNEHHDGALEDLLALIYAEVKRRGGIVKVHQGGASRLPTNMNVYDYLWVGEGVRNADAFREAVKNHPPYVVPCLDMSRAKIENEDELYLESIPYMQFPLLLAGRPFTGERALIPGIRYQPEEKDFWTRHCRAIWRYYQAHPQGPYSYGWWDSVPGRPEAQPTHARWLKQYLPLVEEGTWAWLEITDSSLFRRLLPQNVVASAFANRELYLVVANYGQDSAEIETSDAYYHAADPAVARTHWKLGARSLQILKRSRQS